MTIENLRTFGADVEDGLARCINKEDFYLKMVNMGLGDERFTELPKAIEAGDTDRAFELAHALKGVIGNLALTPMYEPVCKLTELLRHKEPGDYMALCKEICKLRERLLSMDDD